MRWLTALLVPIALAGLAATVAAPRPAPALHTVGSCLPRVSTQVVQAGSTGAGGGRIGVTPGRANVTDTTPRQGEEKPAEPEQPARKSRPVESEPAVRPAPEAEQPSRRKAPADDQELSRGGLPLETFRRQQESVTAAQPVQQIQPVTRVFLTLRVPQCRGGFR